MNTSVDRKLSNGPIAPPVNTQVFGDKLSNSSSRDLYTRCRVNLTTDSTNPVTPQFLNRGISAVNLLNKSSNIWITANRIIRSPDVTHCSAVDHTVGKNAAVADAVGAK